MSDCDLVYPFPGKSQSLFLIVEELDFAVTTRTALDAIDALRSAWEPLSAEAILFALDGDDSETASVVDIARPHRLLIKKSIDTGIVVESMMIDPVVAVEDDLSRCAIDIWLANALRDVITGDGQHGEWSQLRFDASRARVGSRDWRQGSAAVHLEHEVGTVVVPIERTSSGAWLSGPREPASDQPPVGVRITNQTGRLTLRVTRHYGYWTDPREPAAQHLDEVIDRLRELGWENDS